MRYFNGFSLHNEESLFSDYLINSTLCVSGFSYGAQEAFEYVYHAKERIDRLILISPAFFQTQKLSFTRTQLRYFEAGKEAYIEQFLTNVTHPSNINLSSYLKVGDKEELNALLSYQWDRDKIQEVLNRGTTIEVFLGSEDKIIDIEEAYTFFSPLATTYYIKGVGHLLHK